MYEGVEPQNLYDLKPVLQTPNAEHQLRTTTFIVIKSLYNASKLKLVEGFQE